MLQANLSAIKFSLADKRGQIENWVPYIVITLELIQAIHTRANSFLISSARASIHPLALLALWKAELIVLSVMISSAAILFKSVRKPRSDCGL